MLTRMTIALVFVVCLVGCVSEAMAKPWRVGGVASSAHARTLSASSSTLRIQSTARHFVKEYVKNSATEVGKEYSRDVLHDQELPELLVVASDELSDPLFHLERFDEVLDEKSALKACLPTGARGLAVIGVERFAVRTLTSRIGRTSVWAILRSPTGRGLLAQGLKYGWSWVPTKAVMLSIAKRLAIRGFIGSVGWVLLVKDAWDLGQWAYDSIGQWAYDFITAKYKAARKLVQSGVSTHKAIDKHAEKLLKHMEIPEPNR